MKQDCFYSLQLDKKLCFRNENAMADRKGK